MAVITTIAGIAMGLIITGLAAALIYEEYQDVKEARDAKREDRREARKKKKVGWDAIYKKMEGE